VDTTGADLSFVRMTKGWFLQVRDKTYKKKEAKQKRGDRD
jgi:hypothetical protein